MAICVKTVYGEQSMRLPYISTFKTDAEAKSMINTIRKWGLDIVSCGRISTTEAKKLLKEDKAESDVKI